jgi:hypothetical protein
MKKVTLLLFISASFLSGFGQQWVNSTGNPNNINSTNSGNVGIGTTSPQAKLDVEGQVSLLSALHKFYFSEGSSFDPLKAGVRNNLGNLSLNAKDGAILYLNRDVNAATRIQATTGAITTEIASFNPDGNVGIGTTTPQAKLDVKGQFYLNRPALLQDNLSTLGIPTGSYLGIAPSNLSATNNSYITLNFPTNNSFRIATGYDGHLGIGTYRDLEFGRISGNPYLIIKDGGNVGIGTTTPGSFKLAVEGKIGAREVKVTLDSWADYVFNKDYKLMSLASLETFIQKNNHLPNIPSAQQVKEEGIQLGEMNTKLLEKIEELTLHMIQMNKKVEQLQKENGEIKKQVTELEKK